MLSEKAISEKLRGLRAEKRYSLEQIAEKIGVHRETFRKYENNPYEMSVETFIKVLNIYNTDPLIFFDTIMANCQRKEV